jgi:hypothetical protein
MTDRSPAVAGLALTALLLTSACEDNPPDADISQFDRPQDVALVCYDRVEADGGVATETYPLDCCRSSGHGVEGYCSGPLPEAGLLAFVTQTTPGEVAVVDVGSQSIIDQDERIPYNSFVPVGGQPNDIAATWDGSKVVTSNLETEDLSVIEVAEVFTGEIVPAVVIPLSGPGGRIAIAKAESIRGRFAFVTMPTMGRLSVISLDPDLCPASTGGEAPVVGCELGYMRLDSATGIPHAVEDDSPEGIAPWALVASEQTPALFVGGIDGHYLAEIDSEILVSAALELAEPGPLGEVALVRRLELEEFTSSAIALEPRLERWIYAVENERGGVLVVDLLEGEILPINEDDPLAEDAYSIDLPGRAEAVAMLRLDEEPGEDDDPTLTFNGTFGVVSTSKAALFVVDADDSYADPFDPHSLRSAVDLSDEENLPYVVEDPILEADGTQISGQEADDLAHFAEPDAGAGDAGLPDCEQEGVDFGPDDDYGIRFACDPRRSSSEKWTLSWEGEVGVSGAAVLWELEPAAGEGGHLVVVDESKSYCAQGVLGRDQGQTYDGISELEGYQGDLFVVTSEPTPLEGADCSEFEDLELVYQISEILDEDGLRLERLDSQTPWLDEQCFGQAFTYEIRAWRHWVLKGSSTGHLEHGSYDVQGQCVPVAEDPDEEEQRLHYKRQRVFEGHDFYNYYFTFRLEGSGAQGKKEFEELAFTFETDGGFRPLYAVLGNQMTDIVPTPEDELIIIDQAGQGLIIFDMLGDFEIVGAAVD